jgi:hypothetical protein
MEVLTTWQADAWRQVLDRCGRYDFYHLPRYHAMAEEAGEGTAWLFHYAEGDFVIAVPLLLRPLDGLPGAQPGWQDATSVYGYAGPISSHAEVPTDITKRFQAALAARLHDMRVVTLFSRLNAFLPQSHVLAGIGECQALKHTVSIDLTLPPETQRASYRKKYKEAVNKLRRLEWTCIQDRDGVYLDDFVRVYHETMRRVDAEPMYFFPAAYFRQLREVEGGNCPLFVCLQEGHVVCGGIFLACGGILQYHLGGTADDALKLAPMKLLVDEVRLWATAAKMNVLHLGGGVSASPDDPLLHFKLGFSDRVDDFSVWRWVLDPDAYGRLCQEKAHADRQAGFGAARPGFFPEYRSPAAPIFAEVCTPLAPATDPAQLSSEGVS